MKAITVTDEQMTVFTRLLSGAALQLAISPFQWWWLLFLPRLIRGLWATALSESALNPDAVGDGGDSVGVLQFRSATWSELEAGQLNDRLNPFASGRAATMYLGKAARPLALISPVGGLRAWRILWTRGVQMTEPPDETAWGKRYLDPEGFAARAWGQPPTIYYLAWIVVFFLWQTPVTAAATAVGLMKVKRRR